MKILAPHLRSGMTVLEPGPGMGFFTLDIARLVGPEGRVVAVDIQPQMLDVLTKRSLKAGLGSRVETRLAEPGNLCVESLKNKVDFVLAFALVHELPNPTDFFTQIQETLKPKGRILMAEPSGHVTTMGFAHSLAAANFCGLRAVESPNIWRSHTALLEKEK
jgi:ubiquinone/menaquinone biosynthesis C-methylase UbiE